MEFVLQRHRELHDVCFLEKLLHARVGNARARTRLLAKGIEHLQNRGQLLFGEQIHLQIQVSAPIGVAGQAILAHEDKAGEEDGFEGYADVQQTKGIGIECVWASIRQDPSNEPYDMREYERSTARKRRDRVSEPIETGTMVYRLTLKFNNCANVLDEGICDTHADWFSNAVPS
jgi:hypothetical protein